MSVIDPTIVESLLGDRLDDRARLLLELLAGREEPSPDVDEVTFDNARTSERAARRRALRHRFREMADELSELRHRHVVLAEALGACPNCWGEERSCPDCGGRGAPGALAISEDSYEALLMPAVTAYKRQQQPLVQDPVGTGDKEGARHG